MAEQTRPARKKFTEELEQLGLQVEVLFVRVDENLERARDLLRTGDAATAERARAADDEIDAMSVSLTERCYEVLARETPVAGDLRLVVSVIRVVGELERIGDLALRVVNIACESESLRDNERVFDILVGMADTAVDAYREVMRAWASAELRVADGALSTVTSIDVHAEQLVAALLELTGPDAVRLAIEAFYAGRALERIADHAVVIAARIQYLITGEAAFLRTEVR